MLTFLDVALFVWLCCCWLLLALPYPWFVAVIETALPLNVTLDESLRTAFTKEMHLRGAA